MKVWIRENDLKRDLKFEENEQKLNKLFQETKIQVHEALCDNFNTPQVLLLLLELMKKVYDYVEKAKNTIKIHLLYSISQYLAFIFKCLGLVYNTEFIDYFKFETSETGKNSEEILAPFIDSITNFRSQIKTACIIDKDIKKVLELCDNFRDNVLPYLGVVIEDKGKDKSIWKFYDKEKYIKEKKQQKELKENQKKQKEEEAKERELKLSTPAKEYFAMQTEYYSKFDEEGVPTHNAKGAPLSKEQITRLKKDFQKHQKMHLKWLEQQEKKNDKEKNKKDKKNKKNEENIEKEEKIPGGEDKKEENK